MKTTEARKDKDLMTLLDKVANGRTIKLHNPSSQYEEIIPTCYHKTSLYEVYKKPSATKVYIDEDIRKSVAYYFNTSKNTIWYYRGNCNTFTMETDIYYQPTMHMIRLTFTACNLHVIVW